MSKEQISKPRKSGARDCKRAQNRRLRRAAKRDPQNAPTKRRYRGYQ